MGDNTRANVASAGGAHALIAKPGKKGQKKHGQDISSRRLPHLLLFIMDQLLPSLPKV